MIANQIQQGALRGLGELALNTGKSLWLNFVTAGAYGVYSNGRAMYEGYKEDGALGALNAINPLYHLARGVENSIDALERGDYEAVGAIGAPTAVLGVALGVGVGRALGAGGAAAQGAARAGVTAGEAGSFASLKARSVIGDGLTPHHMPQAALRFTSRADGGALVLPHAEHMLTRTYLGRGVATARAEAGLSFRQILARDIRDVRQIAGTKYDQGIRELLTYYRDNFPNLMTK